MGSSPLEQFLGEIVTPAELKKYENIYQQKLRDKTVEPKNQFDYALCLVRSPYDDDIKRGIVLLEELSRTDKDGVRDYLYYLIIAHARQKQYSKALKCCDCFLSVEPANTQVRLLEKEIKKKLKKDGLVGMAIAGGAVLAVGALVGIAISGRSKS